MSNKGWPDTAEDVVAIHSMDYVVEDYSLRFWNELEHELLNNNRYFPKSQLMEYIKEFSLIAKSQLNKNEVVYRARRADDSLFSSIRNIINNDHSLDKLNQMSQDKRNDFYRNVKNNYADLMESHPANDETMFTYVNIFSKFNDNYKKSGFWGFNSTESDVPPKNKCSGGRANPPGIQCLYTASSDKTAIAEIRPDTNEYISVADIRIINELTLFDFTLPKKTNSQDRIEKGKSFLLSAIGKRFSRPVFADSAKYLASQFICEYLKSLSFDGIKYESAVDPDGINIALFNDSHTRKNYEILSSRLVKVTNISYIIDQVLPTTND